ncbi:MAG: S-layer homology domain-containing protein [Candidatus Ancillula sp.]|jgi:hypothetical protein|nr:S-layer homology domain-containing protein [Candidatus Ancillula sp.]
MLKNSISRKSKYVLSVSALFLLGVFALAIYNFAHAVEVDSDNVPDSFSVQLQNWTENGASDNKAEFSATLPDDMPYAGDNDAETIIWNIVDSTSEDGPWNIVATDTLQGGGMPGDRFDLFANNLSPLAETTYYKVQVIQTDSDYDTEAEVSSEITSLSVYENTFDTGYSATDFALKYASSAVGQNSFVIPASYVPEKPGYKFLGWKNSDGVLVQPGQSTGTLSKSEYWTAQYKDVTRPTLPDSDPEVNFSNPSDGAVTVNFKEATDNATPQADLKYFVEACEKDNDNTCLGGLDIGGGDKADNNSEISITYSGLTNGTEYNWHIYVCDTTMSNGIACDNTGVEYPVYYAGVHKITYDLNGATYPAQEDVQPSYITRNTSVSPDQPNSIVANYTQIGIPTRPLAEVNKVCIDGTLCQSPLNSDENAQNTYNYFKEQTDDQHPEMGVNPTLTYNWQYIPPSVSDNVAYDTETLEIRGLDDYAFVCTSPDSNCQPLSTATIGSQDYDISSLIPAADTEAESYSFYQVTPQKNPGDDGYIYPSIASSPITFLPRLETPVLDSWSEQSASAGADDGKVSGADANAVYNFKNTSTDVIGQYTANGQGVIENVPAGTYKVQLAPIATQNAASLWSDEVISIDSDVQISGYTTVIPDHTSGNVEFGLNIVGDADSEAEVSWTVTANDINVCSSSTAVVGTTCSGFVDSGAENIVIKATYKANQNITDQITFTYNHYRVSLNDNGSLEGAQPDLWANDSNYQFNLPNLTNELYNVEAYCPDGTYCSGMRFPDGTTTNISTLMPYGDGYNVVLTQNWQYKPIPEMKLDYVNQEIYPTAGTDTNVFVDDYQKLCFFTADSDCQAESNSNGVMDITDLIPEVGANSLTLPIYQTSSLNPGDPNYVFNGAEINYLENVTIDPRPSAPEVTGNNSTTYNSQDGYLSGFTASAQYRLCTWAVDHCAYETDVTADNQGEIAGLGAGTYKVKSDASETAFASDYSEAATITAPRKEVGNYIELSINQGDSDFGNGSEGGYIFNPKQVYYSNNTDEATPETIEILAEPDFELVDTSLNILPSCEVQIPAGDGQAETAIPGCYIHPVSGLGLGHEVNKAAVYAAGPDNYQFTSDELAKGTASYNIVVSRETLKAELLDSTSSKVRFTPNLGGMSQYQNVAQYGIGSAFGQFDICGPTSISQSCEADIPVGSNSIYLILINDNFNLFDKQMMTLDIYKVTTDTDGGNLVADWYAEDLSANTHSDVVYNTGIATKDNYVFDHWSVSANGQVVNSSVQANSQIALDAYETIYNSYEYKLVANYSTFTVKFDNGAEDIYPEVQNQDITTSVEIPTVSDKEVENGYIPFEYWCLDGNTCSNDQQVEPSVIDGNKTISELFTQKYSSIGKDNLELTLTANWGSLVCDSGYHVDADACVEDTPQPPVCEEGTHLVGDTCVEDDAEPEPEDCTNSDWAAENPDQCVEPEPEPEPEPTIPCQWNPALIDTDPECVEPITPCQWNPALSDTDPECVEPSAPCQWNSSISADDPNCVQPTPPEVVCSATQHKVNNVCQDNLPTTFKLSASSVTLTTNWGDRDTKIIKMTITSKDGPLANDYTLPNYKISNSDIVSISRPAPLTFKIKGLRAGTSTITVTLKNGLKATLKVKVVLPKSYLYSNSFVDIKGLNSEFKGYIKWMYSYGITKGTTTWTYSPSNPVRRDQMAMFIYRLVGQPNYTNNKANFKDVKTKDESYKSVMWLVNEGVTTGYEDKTYKPAGSVSRVQMALFMYRLAKAQGEDVTTGVKTSNTYKIKDWSSVAKYGTEAKKAVNWLIKVGVSTQKKANYWPSQPVTRAQMAAFMNRLYNSSLIK